MKEELTAFFSQEGCCKRMSLFDLDHTLFRGNSSFYFGVYLYRKKIFNTPKMLQLASTYALHKLKLFSLSRLHEIIFRNLFKGRNSSFFEQLVDDFLEHNFNKLLHLPAIECLLKAQHRGDFVAILSNSPDFLVAKIVKKLNVSFWQASVYSLDQSGSFSGILNLLQGGEKAAWVELLASKLSVHKKNICVYTDSILDLPFLEVAGEPIAVNPDKKLRALCLQRGWKILS